MSREWDTSLKLLFGEKLEDFVSWLVPGAKFRRVVSPHLPGRKIDADCLFEIILSRKRLLFHIEFQSYHDSSMVERLWEYNVRATLKYKLPVLSFILYLKKERKPATSPYTWKLPNGKIVHHFDFAVVKLWEVRAETLKQTGLVGLLPLVPLTQDGSRLKIVDEVVTRLEVAGGESASELLALTYLLASYVLKKEHERKWLERRFYMLRDVIRSTWAYEQFKQEGLEEGLEKGLEKGLQEQRQTLLEIVQGRFPALEPEAKKAAEAVSDSAALRHLTVQVSMAQSEEAARQVFLSPEKK